MFHKKHTMLYSEYSFHKRTASVSLFHSSTMRAPPRPALARIAYPERSLSALVDMASRPFIKPRARITDFSLIAPVYWRRLVGEAAAPVDSSTSRPAAYEA